MSEHTKGPWNADKVSEGYVFDNNEILIAAAHCQETHYNAAGVSAVKMMANARLIAAAPELLEAATWTSKGEHHPACKARKGHKCDCYVGACQAAIAAATT